MRKKSAKDKIYDLTVTFDKRSKQFVWQAILADRINPLCPFCQSTVTLKKFKGAIHYSNERRIIDGCLASIMWLADNASKLKKE